MNKTIFRVVGGGSRRNTLNEYEIIPYEVIKETPRYYTTVRGGRTELQQKRTTSNSEWFEDIEGSLRAVLKRIDGAIQMVHQSKEEVVNFTFPKFPVVRYVYVCKFSQEKFELEFFKFQHYTYGVNGKGWRIDNPKIRSGKKRLDTGFLKDVTLPQGRSYIYEHKSQPHNANRPIERWVGLSLSSIQIFVEQYAKDRIKHLERRKQKLTDWVRQYERLSDEKQ